MALRTDAWPRSRASTLAVAATVVVSGAWGCGLPASQGAGPEPAASSWTPVRPDTTVAITPTPAVPAPSTTGALPPGATASPSSSLAPPSRPLASDGKPREARLTIPALDIERLRVQPHRGSPDDARGTRIQDGGIAASPYGPDGGVGPGGIGNHIITAHRLSSTRAFLDLPSLRVGAKIYLDAAGQRYTYRIVRTRITSFRSPESLAAQAAPVPGRPGERAVRAMITLSTCRTPEDRAEGNHWSDELGNPEHRIDKIGELVSIRSL
jgi:sortase A